MCGIAAFLDSANPLDPEKQQDFREILQIMRDRGPDASGILSGANWILGHTRLAIIAPDDSGAQPWTSDDGLCSLTFNGEIYNFRELRAELKSKGHAFRSDCDTEVLMEAYREWGTGALDRLNGFFAFVLIDRKKKCLFAARDRIGIKPFFFAVEGSRFAAASTIPALRKAISLDAAPDFAAVSHYLSTTRPVMGEHTLLRGIRTLPPAHLLTLPLEGVKAEVRIRRYWRRPILSEQEKQESAPDFSDAVEQTRALLEDSVRMRLVSDVPLGAFLSGGLDSSIIALCAKRHASGDLPLFCAGTESEADNEFQYAAEMAEKLGLNVRNIVINSQDFGNSWNRLIRQKGLPLSTPNEYSIYRLADALSHSCKVTLTGEGADELFGGYILPQYSAWELDFIERNRNAANFDDFPLTQAMLLQYGRANYLNDTDHYLSNNTWLSYPEKAALFQKNIWDGIEEDTPVFKFYETFFEEHQKASAFDRRMHLFAEYNLENLLARIDNSTMMASVEARVPFTDYRLVELAFSMPDSYKIDFRRESDRSCQHSMLAAELDRRDLLESKRLPRNAFAGELPRDIVERKKMSFPVPFAEWLSGPLFQEVRSICLDTPFPQAVFQRNALENYLKNPGPKLWVLANLCKWAAAVL